MKSSYRSNLINKWIIIYRGLVCPSVRVLVTARLLREFGCARGRCEGYLEAGLWLNNWNKLSVYMNLHGLLDWFHSLKSNLLLISCSYAKPIEFSIGLPKLDKTYLHLPNYFYSYQFCNIRNFNIYWRTNIRYNFLEQNT